MNNQFVALATLQRSLLLLGGIILLWANPALAEQWYGLSESGGTQVRIDLPGQQLASFLCNPIRNLSLPYSVTQIHSGREYAGYLFLSEPDTVLRVQGCASPTGPTRIEVEAYYEEKLGNREWCKGRLQLTVSEPRGTGMIRWLSTDSVPGYACSSQGFNIDVPISRNR